MADMATPSHLQVTERLIDHLDKGSTDTAPQGELRIPGRHYVDEDHAARERRHLFGQPIVVGHASQIPEPGSFITLEVLGVPLLIVRQDDGSARAFRNVCRHRGGRVEPQESGTKRIFTCRYHGWAYTGEGDLRTIPYGEYFPAVDKTCTGLVPVALEERHGLLWACLGATDDIDVAAHLGATFDEELAKLGMESCDLHAERVVTQPINWKLVVEGAIDVLHLKFLHPSTVGRLIQTNTHVWDDFGDHGRLSMARRKMDTASRDVDDVDDLRAYIVSSSYIYPNSMVNVQPRSYEVWTVLPDAHSAGASTIFIRVLVARDATEEELATVEKSITVLVEAAENDDWPMERSIQAGVRETGYDSFVCGTNEVPIQHLHRRLAANLTADE
jgi:phenylpropionate dioxygenase-like ring-hydroxylating dioxygenase large terminal subunit